MPASTKRRPRFVWLGPVFVATLCLLGLAPAGCGTSATAETTRTTIAGSSTTEAVSETTTAATSATTSSTAATVTAVAAELPELFDSSIVHEITVSFSQEDYDAMIQTYKDSGEKDWIEAAVTIDGERYENVGMRLKGNSSIMGLRNGERARGPGANSSAAEPEGLPWLIRLDKNVEGQSHEGIVDLVVRSNTSETALNEAVSLELLEMAGLASQKAIAVKFSVNGSEAVLRLVTELPDDLWMEEHFDEGGALYKAESTGDYSYRGADPDSYDEVFDQEAGKDNADLTPLIEFLDFVNNADDATYSEELPDRLDVDSFATYLAMEELLGNFDDIDGPGNNSYLYYDPAAGMFTIVPWDHNLAFGGMGGGKNMQGGGAPPAGARDGFGGQMPGGQTPDAQQGGVATPQPAQPGDDATGGDAARVAGGRGKSNILVERFHADPEFERLYQQKLAELTAQLYDSGAAAGTLDDWVTLLKTQASDLVDSATVDQDAAKIAAYFTAR
jgi:spore coat protein CotH